MPLNNPVRFTGGTSDHVFLIEYSGNENVVCP